MQSKKIQHTKKHLSEGISRRIKRDMEDIIDSLSSDLHRRADRIKDEYILISRQAEALAQATNRCYALWVSDSPPLKISSSCSPLILLKYSRIFVEGLITLRGQEIIYKKQKKRESQLAANSYNSNNVYELIAKKNIEFTELESQINDLKMEKQLASRKAQVAQQMAEAVRVQSEELLHAYRHNFGRMTDLLRIAEQKQTQLLQNNRLMSEKLENLTKQYENYKMNFKSRAGSSEKENRLRQRMHKEYEDRLKRQMKQVEIQLKGALKSK